MSITHAPLADDDDCRFEGNDVPRLRHFAVLHSSTLHLYQTSQAFMNRETPTATLCVMR